MAQLSEDELRDKVGQLFIVGFHGHTPSNDIKNLIQRHRVGAIILFSRNVSSATQLLELTNSLQSLAKEAGYQQGLFIAIDQENGLVTRIKPPVATQLPGSMALGATDDAENAYKVARATAETLVGFGINMNYAPIADVNSEPKNPVIGVRSPSDDPETVGRFASAQVRGLKDGNIVPCVKHFPGHGDTAVDSHFGLPVIDKSRAELDTCELVPFRRAVVEGVDLVMAAHISIPSIGNSKLPASLNPDTIKILREEMKYDGLIITDCLEMDGVRATYGTEKGAVMALKAGTDCVMVSHTISAQVGAIEEVIKAVKSGEISHKSIEASVNRVEALKSKYSVKSEVIPIATLEDVPKKDTDHSTLASKMYAKSTTMVRNAKGTIPIPSMGHDKKIVFVSPGKTQTSGGAVESGEQETREPSDSDSYITILRLVKPDILDIQFYDGVKLSEGDEKTITEADIVILATQNACLSPYQKDLGLLLAEKLGKKLIAIAICDPYDFLENKEIETYVTIYEPTIPAFKSAVDILFGLATAQGHLPVGTPRAQHSIRHFEPSDEGILQLWKLWEQIFPKWSIAIPRLTKILKVPHGKHYIHERGFCLSFLMEGPDGALHGKVAAVGVLPDFRKKGLGTTFLSAAKSGLRISAGTRVLKTLQIGSVFPRLWPQVPITFSPADKSFFLHRGFRHPYAPTARDMFKSIVESIAPPETMARVAALNIKFTPWTLDMYEECMIKQRRQFKNIGWVEAYQRLHEANQHHEVMVAIDPATNEQIGWTLMCSLDAVVADDFAFLPLMPSGEKTGLIGCVGVDEGSRGKGIGLGLLVKAMEDMRRRGIEGVGIDWVVIRGFYERLGFTPLWEYEGYEW